MPALSSYSEYSLVLTTYSWSLVLCYKRQYKTGLNQMNYNLIEKGIQNALGPIVHVVHLTTRKSSPQDLHKMTLAWASSICCCSITCHFELGRHKSKLFSTFSTNGNVPNNTSSFYLHLLQGALKNYLIFSLTLHIIFSHCRSFSWWFLPQILTKILTPGEFSFIALSKFGTE